MTASVVFRLSIVLSQKIYAPRLELLILLWRDSMSDIAIMSCLSQVRHESRVLLSSCY